MTKHPASETGQHTPEPWHSGDLQIILGCEVPDGSRREIGRVYKLEDRRRIVACVNACAGIPLEMLLDDGDGRVSLSTINRTVQAERDHLRELLRVAEAGRGRLREEKAELLAALKDMYQLVTTLLPAPPGRMAEIYIDNTPGLRPRIDAARDAIDKAEGGALVRNRVGEALDRIASTLREGELLDDTYHHYHQRCDRSTAAAYAELDKLIVIAREAQGGAP